MSRALCLSLSLVLLPACDSDSGTTTADTAGSTTAATTTGGSTTTSGSTAATTEGSSSGASASTTAATTGPLADCASETERTACLALNDGMTNPACAWIDVVPVDGTCNFGNAEAECVALTHTGACDDANTCAGAPVNDLWWRQGADGVELFQFDYCEDQPIGWTQCTWDAGAGPDEVTPAECACACP